MSICGYGNNLTSAGGGRESSRGEGRRGDGHMQPESCWVCLFVLLKFFVFLLFGLTKRPFRYVLWFLKQLQVFVVSQRLQVTQAQDLCEWWLWATSKNFDKKSNQRNVFLQCQVNHLPLEFEMVQSSGFADSNTRIWAGSKTQYGKGSPVFPVLTYVDSVWPKARVPSKT